MRHFPLITSSFSFYIYILHLHLHRIPLAVVNTVKNSPIFFVNHSVYIKKCKQIYRNLTRMQQTYVYNVHMHAACL